MIALLLSLVMLLTSPVSADETGSKWVSFLDYDTGTDSGNYLNFTSSGTMEYSLPFTASVRSVQGIFQSSGGTVTSVSLQRMGSDSEYSCTLISLGNSLYRFYLTGTNIALNNAVFYLHFENDGSRNTVLRLLEFEYSEVRSIQYQETGTLYVTGGGLDTPYRGTMSASSSPVTCNFPSGLDTNYSFTAQIYLTDWKKYDYIDFWITGYTEEACSFTAGCDGIYLPCYVTEVPVQGSDGVIDFSVIVRVDLSSIDRTSTYTPMLVVRGFAGNKFNGVASQLSLRNTVGIVSYDEPDALYSFLRIFVNGFAYLEQYAYMTHDELYVLHEQWLEASQVLQNSIDSFRADVSDAFASLESTFSSKISDLQSKLTSLITGFRTSMESWAGTISGKLDQLIGGTTEGDELSEGAQEMEDQVSDVADFEQSQQAVLDNSLPEIQASVSVASFTSALAFVQRYLTLGFDSLGDSIIIYFFPLFLGLFFFICNRLPGATSSHRPPKSNAGKGGDSV